MQPRFNNGPVFLFLLGRGSGPFFFSISSSDPGPDIIYVVRVRFLSVPGPGLSPVFFFLSGSGFFLSILSPGPDFIKQVRVLTRILYISSPVPVRILSSMSGS